jgi:membrane-associated protein
MTLLALGALIPNFSILLPQLIGQYGWLVYIGLFLLVFVETGVVVMPFLPGDSLLFLCGSLAAMSTHPLNLIVLAVALSIAAILGDGLNFEIGEHFGHYLTGARWFQRVVKPEHMAQSERFFAKHGKTAIFLGRFMPIIRTLIPFTAGASKMRYRDFALFNVIGGISWVLVVLSAGYFFGNIAVVKSHFELIMLAIVVISLLPAGYLAMKKRGGVKNVN